METMSDDGMLEEARIWLHEPPLRKCKLESPVPSPPEPVYLDDSSDEEMDPVEREKYRKQVVESCGFDVDGCIFHPSNVVVPVGYTADENLVGKIGLHCYNIEKGTNLQFGRIIKVNAGRASLTTFYLTLEAMDPVEKSVLTFQTSNFSVDYAGNPNKERLVLRTIICRTKPQVPGHGDANFFWDFDAIDDFYKGDLPNWLHDDVVTGSDKLQFYEVTESDLLENVWLYLYAEVALFSKLQFDLSDFMPFKMKKIIVQTKNDVVSKLKARNAIFYLNFETSCGTECKGIIRKTTDGRFGHISLEGKCWI